MSYVKICVKNTINKCNILKTLNIRPVVYWYDKVLEYGQSSLTTNPSSHFLIRSLLLV